MWIPTLFFKENSCTQLCVLYVLGIIFFYFRESRLKYTLVLDCVKNFYILQLSNCMQIFETFQWFVHCITFLHPISDLYSSVSTRRRRISIFYILENIYFWHCFPKIVRFRLVIMRLREKENRRSDNIFGSWAKDFRYANPPQNLFRDPWQFTKALDSNSKQLLGQRETCIP